MKQLYTEITINSTPSRVWQVLTDFEKYPDWNPFIPSISGQLKEGSRLKVQIQPPDSNPMTFKPLVKKVKPEEEFRWLGNLLIPGLFDGEHIFELKEHGNGQTLFIQRENFKGFLVSFLWKKLEPNTKKGFELMNQKVKELSEAVT